MTNDVKDWKQFSRPADGRILAPRKTVNEMKGFFCSSFLLVLTLSGCWGEETKKREQENGREIGKLRESSEISRRERRNLLGSLLTVPYRRQPLRLPGVGTPRG